jgi:hypothetical protein
MVSLTAGSSADPVSVYPPFLIETVGASVVVVGVVYNSAVV